MVKVPVGVLATPAEDWPLPGSAQTFLQTSRHRVFLCVACRPSPLSWHEYAGGVQSYRGTPLTDRVQDIVEIYGRIGAGSYDP